jgi:PAS domain S-box-containing protein
MNLSSFMGTGWVCGPRVLSDDEGILLCRASREGQGGERDIVLAVLPAAEHPTPQILDRLAHEYELRDELDGAWAAKPLELVQDATRTILVLEDGGGEPLIVGAPIEIGSFLRLAVHFAAALGKVHRRGLVHKDIKPANILVNRSSGKVQLTGFGFASRRPRERQSPAPLESIAGTLAYMAPEQTGRMNRSIDSRSDLYSLGVTLYQMLTGSLPFTASDPMELIHCHLARQPVPPSERVQNVPIPVSAIVMKLLAKTAEDRYQTAAGLERDLRCCLEQWEARSRIDDFRLGEHDTPDRLLIAENMYGRAREVETLLASFDRIVTSGVPKLVLVSGYSGIGKSSVVNELHKVLVPPRGLFASGKFDQYKRDVPYATLVQAFQSLVRPLLSKSDAELAGWRDAILEALGPNARLVVDLVPELKLIIGEQPPIPELPPQQAHSRFQLVFRRFISVFARPEHPLVLFLDDLQWLDAATLDLLEDLLLEPDVQQLMLIGSYRDNEVASNHPLTRKLAAIRQGATVEEIKLAPLTCDDLGQLIVDSLRCDQERAAPLAQLVHQKTEGNPFFAIQFISALVEEGMLTFDHDNTRWSWDLDRIHAKRYTDNVVDLMLGKLSRLPGATQQALQQFACLGNLAEIDALVMLQGTSEEAVHAELWEAARLGLIERVEASYRFVHDRVQEAAYSLIPETSRAKLHLRVGRLLLAHTPPEKRDEAIFEIVNQLNRAVNLITSLDERVQLAELNLIAGKRAKSSSAYASALKYLIAGGALLSEEFWERQHELIYELELQRSECEFLTGALAEAEQRLATLATRAGNALERATVACLRVDLYTTLDQAGRAVAVALDYLRHLGIDWSTHPAEDEARREYERIWSQLGNRAIEELIDLPSMTDAASLGTIDVLNKVVPPALWTDANLVFLVICRAVNLTLEHGNCDGSCAAYVRLGMMVGARLGDYQVGFRFGRLGYDLVERRGLKGSQPRTYMHFGNVILPMTRHVRAGRDLMRQAFEAANKIGDLICGSYYGLHMATNRLMAGDPLAETQREAENGLAFAEKARFGLAIDIIATQLGLMRTLRGLTPVFGSFDDEHFDELRIERRFLETPDLALSECWYWIRKLQARFFAGDIAAAVEASSRAQGLLRTSASYLEEAEYHLYGALAHGASCDLTTGDERERHLAAITAHHRQLELRAQACPENFENRAALVGAEIARIEGRELDAERLYEKAIGSARANGFIHNEALANELASRFYAGRGFGRFANLHLWDARYGYLRWGADGKVRQLERLYPRLHIADEGGAVGKVGEPVQHMDVTAVVRASQAVSSEIELPGLIETLMKIALQNAGADRGLLILSRDNGFWIEAEGQASGNGIAVVMYHAPVSGPDCPEALLRHVIRTQKTLILDDASQSIALCGEDYVHRRHPRSILCLPLMKQANLAGLLYFENALATHAFTPDRIAVLELLASQAAISLDNTLLYRDLREREARIRRLVDSNIIGILFWDAHGNISYANDAFLSMTGYTRQELISGAVGWKEMTPAEYHADDAQRVDQLRLLGQLPPREKEFFRKDGSRLPVLIGSALLTESRDHGISFVLDLTERKQAEAEARESERRYQDMQLELAHANRVATMGQLTSSIAHEVSQPISAVAINAGAALNWLGRKPPDFEKALTSIEEIAKDAHRSSEVLGRIRELFKKAPPRKERLDLNEAVREVIVLTRSEALKNQITVKTLLAEGLPSIEGDRVQLQQVLLNLVVNAVQAMTNTTDRARDLLITTAPSGSNFVLVRVADSGPGLDPQMLERIFDPYYTTKTEGLGMGLTICRSIMDAHNGRLWASANQPRGVVFQFTLPADLDGGI